MNQNEKKSSPSSPKKFRRGPLSNLVFQIKKIFGLALPDTFIFDNRVVFELAFILNNESYYWVPDQTEAPAERALMANVIYEEMRMGANKEYLLKHCEEVDKILSQKRPSIADLGRLHKLHFHLKERAEMSLVPEYIYKLASVIFLHQDESPVHYDPIFNKKKIEAFKNSPDGVAFFLSTPLKYLMPSLSQPGNDIRKFSKIIEEVDRVHQAFLHDDRFKKV